MRENWKNKKKKLRLDLRSLGQLLNWTTARDTHLLYGQDLSVGDREDAMPVPP